MKRPGRALPCVRLDAQRQVVREAHRARCGDQWTVHLANGRHPDASSRRRSTSPRPSPRHAGTPPIRGSCATR
jgi:hypothetical protein